VLRKVFYFKQTTKGGIMKKFNGFRYRSSCHVWLWAFLALIGLMVLSSSAFALTEGDYEYTESGGNATITGYTGAGGDISIPATLGGYPVVAIGAYAFTGNTTLTSVIIPNSVTDIKESTFAFCTSLTSVTINSSVTNIEDYAFLSCFALTRAYFLGNAPSLGGNVFGDCASNFTICYTAGATGFTTPTWTTSSGDTYPAAPCVPVTTTTTVAPTTTTIPSCLDNSDCGSGEFCAKAPGDCNGSGQCTLKPEACAPVTDLVCGCNGLTYLNACYAANQAGVNVNYAGSCSTPTTVPTTTPTTVPTTTTTTQPVTTTTTTTVLQCADQYQTGEPYLYYTGSNMNCPFVDWGLVNYFQHIIPFPYGNVEYYATVHFNGATGCLDLRVVIENNYGAAQYFNNVTDGQQITITIPKSYFDNTNFDGCSSNWFVHTADLGWQFQQCNGGWLGSSIISAPKPGCNLNINTCCPDSTCCTPNAIELSSFTAEPGNGSVTLQWTTETEPDNAGFNILRANKENGDYEQINESLIPSEGSDTQGASYEFVDNDVQNGKKYFYKLEDIDLDGISTMHGPLMVKPKKIHEFLK
jgi:hypothetical protein